ncbi:histidine ammonia-lyase [compost metagenome]
MDNGYQLLGILLVHDAQAVDLRQQRHNGFTLSAPTAALYTAVRKQVPFIEVDRPLAPDFAAAEQVLRQYGKE